MLEWSRETPTEPGEYWCAIDGQERTNRFRVEVVRSGRGLAAIQHLPRGWTQHVPMSSGYALRDKDGVPYLWAGPIPPPREPDEGEDA